MDIDTIIRLRLKLNDPAGYIDIVDGDIPSNPDEQTVYRVSESRYYDYCSQRITILISDSMLDYFLSTNSTELEAQIAALEFMMMKIADDKLESMDSGAESIKFASLSSRYDFYANMLDRLKAKNKGMRVGLTKAPVIAGGNL